MGNMRRDDGHVPALRTFVSPPTVIVKVPSRIVVICSCGWE
jgi:hypothetical protein